MGRRPALDQEALEKIRQGAERGLSERELYELVGVQEAAWYKWKRRAAAASAILPEDWRSLTFDELAQCCDELEIDLSTVARTGGRRNSTRRRHVREDLIRALENRAQRYVDLLVTLERAAPQAKLAILEQLDVLMQGRAMIRRSRTTQRVRYVNGRPVPTGEAIVTTEQVELPPDRQALLKMLEMRWPEEYSPRRLATDGVGDAPDAGATARAVTAALHRMLETVPPPPGQPEDQ